MGSVPFRKSPCCGAKSRVRGIYMEEHRIILRCSKCAQLRIEPLRQTDKPAQRWPRLAIVVNNDRKQD